MNSPGKLCKVQKSLLAWLELQEFSNYLKIVWKSSKDPSNLKPEAWNDRKHWYETMHLVYLIVMILKSLEISESDF